MLLTLRDRLYRDDEGFTLIELLVVVIIIGVLAAIAIPTFLNQRESAWRGSVESDLRNAAIEMETLLTEEGSYACGATGQPVCPDFATSDGVTVSVVSTSASSYCLEGTHAELAGTWSYGPAQPNLQDVGCAGRT